MHFQPPPPPSGDARQVNSNKNPPEPEPCQSWLENMPSPALSCSPECSRTPLTPSPQPPTRNHTPTDTTSFQSSRQGLVGAGFKPALSARRNPPRTRLPSTRTPPRSRNSSELVSRPAASASGGSFRSPPQAENPERLIWNTRHVWQGFLSALGGGFRRYDGLGHTGKPSILNSYPLSGSVSLRVVWKRYL